jgi:hypothetical protein
MGLLPIATGQLPTRSRVGHRQKSAKIGWWRQAGNSYQPAAPHEPTDQPLTDRHLEFRQLLRRDANFTRSTSAISRTAERRVTALLC